MSESGPGLGIFKFLVHIPQAGICQRISFTLYMSGLCLKYSFRVVATLKCMSGIFIWEFAPKRYPKISSLEVILRYPKISLNSNKSKDMYYGYERISLNGYHHGYHRISVYDM